MPIYEAYEGVAHLQNFLEANKTMIGFQVSLVEPNGAWVLSRGKFDGRYGDETAAATRKWLAIEARLNPNRDPWSYLVEQGILTDAQLEEVKTARADYARLSGAPEPGEGPSPRPQPGSDATLPPPPAEDEGWPAWKWLLLGLGIGGAGLLGVYLWKRYGRKRLPRRGGR